MKKILFLLSCVLVFHALSANAQQVQLSSSLNPVGSGARATGMGGAFIAVADDATAASWNPAGLIQLEKTEFSLVYSGFRREQTYDSLSNPELNGTNITNATGINFASIAYPFTVCGRDKTACRSVVFSLNYQRMYEMNKKIDFPEIDRTVTPPDFANYATSCRQEGSLYALSPALAVQVVPSLSLGVTMNFWKDYVGRNGWKSRYHTLTSGSMFSLSVSGVTDYTETVDFEGENMHAGFLWSPVQSITIGGVFKSAFEADLKRSSTLFSRTYLDTMPPSDTSGFEDKQQTLKMPMSYGLGVQYRASDDMVLALDIYRTDWSRFLFRDEQGNESNGRDNKPLSEGRLKDTTQIRLGTEYLFINPKRVIALRGGIFSDPEPEVERRDRYYGIALGTGYSTNVFSVDASYQYRHGEGLKSDMSIKDNKMDVTQHTLMLSVIYYL